MLDRVYKFGTDSLLSVVESYSVKSPDYLSRETVSHTPPGWDLATARAACMGCDDVFFTKTQDGLLMPNRFNECETLGWFPLKKILSSEQKLSKAWTKIKNWWDTGEESPNTDVCNLWKEDAKYTEV